MRKYDIPLGWYGIFCAVARYGNISQAAERLFVSQPSVSMAVKQLEDRLGHPLFARSARGVRLTPEGHLLYSYLEKALNLVDTAEKKFLEMANLESGSVAIGASDTICSQYLLSYLEQYNQANPEIEVRVTNRTSGETLEIVRSGEVDFGFVNLPIDAGEGVEITECMRIHDCLIGGSRFKDIARSGLALASLNEYPLLMLEKTSNTTRLLDRYAAAHGIELKPIIELGSSDLLVKFARINLGLSFVIREFSSEFIDGDALHEIPLSPAPPERAIGMIRLRSIPLSFAAERLISLIITR